MFVIDTWLPLIINVDDHHPPIIRIAPYAVAVIFVDQESSGCYTIPLKNNISTWKHNSSRSFPHSRLITGFVTRLTRRVPLVKQELLTLPEHLSSPPVFSEVRVTRSLVLYVCFVDRCLSCCTFSFSHCVVCSSSIYGFWLPLWYLQTLLIIQQYYSICFSLSV
jgi:hypothetical protein